jgi:hypothetical protein
MRCTRLSVLLVATLIFHQFAAAQSVPDLKVDSGTDVLASSSFPCYAKATNLPKNFNGLWTPKPVNGEESRVRVTIGFTKPDRKFSFECVGEPLEITVPNGQIVNLVRENWPTDPKACTPTVTITPAVGDNAIADVLPILAKIGSLGFVKVKEDKGDPLPPLKNKNLTASVACTVDGRKLTQSVKITYQSPPRIVVSAGLVVSMRGVKSYGIKTTQTGVGSNGVVTAQTSIAVTGSSSAQVIPFSFVNLYWAGSRKLNISTQFGLGVNPNLSSPRIEFFAAPIAIGWHDFYFSPGIHIGQHEVLTGGFSVGETTSGLSKAPIIWGYRGGFGFSLSYNLKPLVKSSGK